MVRSKVETIGKDMVKAMAKDITRDRAGAAKKHYPPAYYRYRQQNPTISIILTKTLKDLLDQQKGNLSYGKFVEQTLRLSLETLNSKVLQDLRNENARLRADYGPALEMLGRYLEKYGLLK